jgi:hypothetical protein
LKKLLIKNFNSEPDADIEMVANQVYWKSGMHKRNKILMMRKQVESKGLNVKPRKNRSRRHVLIDGKMHKVKPTVVLDYDC